ncbi:MAG: FecR family protein [Treponemataceae bacterium]|nr:FecR family protein [Treponemataceae bacterium]
MQKKVKSKLSDALVIIICLSFSALSLWLFYSELNRSAFKDESPIARITFKRKTAQRKFINDLVWDILHQDSPVYDGDTIRTANESEATIYFIDGNVMDLQDNTMALVRLKNGQTEVDFRQGQVEIKTNSDRTINILSNNSLVSLAKGSSLSVKNEKNGNTVLAVQSGSASVQGQQENLSFEAGQALSLSQEGELSKSVLAVLEPESNRKYLNYGKEKLSVPFRWQTGNSEDVKLEISSSPDFSSPVYSQVLNSDKAKDFSVKLASGSYYWRMKTLSDKADQTSGKFMVIYSPAPALISPEKMSSFSFRKKLPFIRFNWTSSDYATSYEFLVSDNPQMEAPIIRQRVSQTSCLVSSLEEGTYYWSVTPYYMMNNIGLAKSSEVRQFSIKKTVQLAQTELLQPLDASYVSTQIPMEDNSVAYKPIAFSWKDNPEADSYTIKVWKKGSMGTNLINETTKNNYYVLDTASIEVENGDWFWSVDVNAYDGSSVASKIRSFYAIDAVLEQRTIFPPDGYHVHEARVDELRYSWKTNVPVESEFQLARDENFEDIIYSYKTSNHNIQGKSLPVGNYYWRIYAKVAELELMTPGKHLVVEPPLAKPENIFPVNNGRALVKKTLPFEFRWKTVEGADYYLIQLARANRPDKILAEKNFVESQNGKNLSASFNLDDFEEGSYIWKVQAFRSESVNASKSTGYIADYKCSLRILKPIQLLYPENKVVLDGVEAIKHPGKASWDFMAKAKNTELVIYKNKVRDENIVFSVKNPEKTVQLPRLYEGTYYWCVKGQTLDDFDVSSIETRSFKVSEISKMPMVQISEPAKNAVLDGEYFRLNHAIVFRWERVPACDRYELTFKDRRGKVYFTKYFDKNTTEFILDDLSILNDYKPKIYWSIEAQTLYEGDLFQNGLVQNQNFTIDLPAVQVKTKKAGTMYGR